MRKLKILFYNWVQFDDDEDRGGGVTVYLRNLTAALVEMGFRVDFLSSGLAYRLEETEPAILRTRNNLEPACRSFQMVNSPLMSPGHASFGWNDRLFDKGPALERFYDFLATEGPYDIVHFNNVEGIPLSFLELKDRFPETLVVFSHHNYFMVCPQVNLWSHEAHHCADFDHGRACADCLVGQPPRAAILAAHQLGTLVKSTGLGAGSAAFRKAFAASHAANVLEDVARLRRADFLASDRVSPPGTETGFARRRRLAVDILNRSVDLNLAVSERVSRILRSHGVRAESCHVSYIGTRLGQILQHAEKRVKPLEPDRLSLAYLGYMRADKGFFFLLDALEALPAALAAKVRIRFAARSNGDPGVIERLDRLRPRLAGLEHVNGYAHKDLPGILGDVDLGVVPVLWEDNLPQVALEMMSHGVPLLTSDKGGAQELGRNADFVFPAGSRHGFAAKLARILSGKVDLADFWRDAMPLRSMEDHIAELLDLYDRSLNKVKTGAAPADPPVPRGSTERMFGSEGDTDLDLLFNLEQWMANHA